MTITLESGRINTVEVRVPTQILLEVWYKVSATGMEIRIEIESSIQNVKTK